MAPLATPNRVRTADSFILILAVAVLADDHAPPVSPFELNVVVAPTQTPCVPESVPAFGAVVTVMVTTEEFVALHTPFVTTAR